MTPTIGRRTASSGAVVGSPGGTRIINTVLQVALEMLEIGMGVQEAAGTLAVPHCTSGRPTRSAPRIAPSRPTSSRR